MTRFFLLSLALLAACTQGLTAKNSPASNTMLTPVSSPSDTRHYGYITLPNRMKVLLISDPKADQAAAALSVNIGSVSNPDDRLGLAHFLEHMLFIGTKKYPQVGGYQKFIGTYGGNTNASTGNTITNFSFTIKPDHLAEALDRFSQFFIAPLFDPKYVEREKHAVDSEYHLKIKDDGRRLNAALNHALNPRSPYRRFSVGSLDTLADHPGDAVHEDLVRFYRTHYSANLMSLTVLGRQSLPQLRTMVEKTFSAVPDINATPYTPTSDQLRLTPPYVPAALSLRPLTNMRSLILLFPLPSFTQDFRNNSIAYIAALLNDASKGSFYATAKEKGWIEGFECSAQNFDPRQGQFEVDFNLTPKGLAHTRELLQMFYAYVAKIRAEGIVPWRYEEVSKLAALSFRYSIRINPFDYVTALADRLHDYPPKAILTAGQLFSHYDPQGIARYLKYLRPENALSILIAPNAPTDKVDANYHTPYQIRKVPQDELQALQHPPAYPNLKLPPKNPYIPTHLTLKPSPESNVTIPKALIHTDGFQLWYRQDMSFGVPRVGVKILLRSPLTSATPADADLLGLWRSLTLKTLEPVAQQAARAGLTLGVDITDAGMILTFFGYDDTVPSLFKTVLSTLAKPPVDAAAFATQKRRLAEKLENTQHARPFEQVLGAALRSLVEHGYAPRQLYDALKPLTLTDLQDYQKRFLQSLEVQMLTLGNLTAKESRTLATELKQTLLPHTRFVHVPRIGVRLPIAGKPRFVDYEVAHTDSALAAVTVDPATDTASWAKWRMLAYLYKGDFYTVLRTRQQLGYVVQAQFFPLHKHPGMISLIESPNTSSREVAARVDTFDADFGRILASKAHPHMFDAARIGVLSILRRKDSSLADRLDRYFSEVLQDHDTFDFNEQLARIVEKLTRHDLAVFYHKRMLQNPIRAYGYSNGTRLGDGNTTRAASPQKQHPAP